MSFSISFVFCHSGALCVIRYIKGLRSFALSDLFCFLGVLGLGGIYSDKQAVIKVRLTALNSKVSFFLVQRVVCEILAMSWISQLPMGHSADLQE